MEQLKDKFGIENIILLTKLNFLKQKSNIKNINIAFFKPNIFSDIHNKTHKSRTFN